MPVTSIDFVTFCLRSVSDERARAILEDLRWPHGKICCPVCESKQPIYKQSRKGVAGYYRCPAAHMGRSPDGPGRPLVFTVRTGTILARSHVPLTKWVCFLALAATAKRDDFTPKLSLSPSKLARRIGVTRKTATEVLRALYVLRFGSVEHESPDGFLLEFMAYVVKLMAQSNKIAS